MSMMLSPSFSPTVKSPLSKECRRARTEIECSEELPISETPCTLKFIHKTGHNYQKRLHNLSLTDFKMNAEDEEAFDSLCRNVSTYMLHNHFAANDSNENVFMNMKYYLKYTKVFCGEVKCYIFRCPRCCIMQQKHNDGNVAGSSPTIYS